MAIKTLALEKAPGPDSLVPEMLKGLPMEMVAQVAEEFTALA